MLQTFLVSYKQLKKLTQELSPDRIRFGIPLFVLLCQNGILINSSGCILTKLHFYWLVQQIHSNLHCKAKQTWILFFPLYPNHLSYRKVYNSTGLLHSSVLKHENYLHKYFLVKCKIVAFPITAKFCP